MPIKSVKIKISKNKKMRFFLMFQGSLDPKIRFLGQKVSSVALVQTDRQTRKWILRTPFQGFRNFSFNLLSRSGPIINLLKFNQVIKIFRRQNTFKFKFSSTNLEFFTSFRKNCTKPWKQIQRQRIRKATPEEPALTSSFTSTYTPHEPSLT